MSSVYYSDPWVVLYHGDCLEVLRDQADASVDSVVTDPPYGLEFMGKDWDAPWKSAEVHAEARSLRAGEMGDESKRRYIASAVNKYAAGAPFQAWCETWAHECLRVLKPGGHLLAFGGTRTSHRLACAIEDAGFEIRDSIAWLYGSGFPKSLDVSKAIDKRRDWSLVERLSGEIRRARAEAGLSLAEIGQATLDATGGTYGKWYHRGGHMFFETGRSLPSRPEWEHLRHVLPIAPEFTDVYDEAEREITGHHDAGNPIGLYEHKHGEGNGRTANERRDIPATPDAQTWQGWGTALKPAHEPVIVARKPLVGTVAANVLAHGTGALNVDGCRIRTTDHLGRPQGTMPQPMDWGNKSSGETFVTEGSPLGRWPANVILDESQAAALDEQSGEQRDGVAVNRNKDPQAEKPHEVYGGGWMNGDLPDRTYGGQGGASRFFFIAREDNDPCHSTSGVNTAGTPSSRQSERDGSAPSGAATTACPDGGRPTGSPSTPATPSGSRPSDESGTPLTTTTGSESSLDSPRAKPSQMVSRARYAESLRPTDTTTTTTSHSTSDGFADLTTSSSTPPSAPGVPLDELGSRFTYVAKADASERVRVNGTAHPTVKPLALMRWLVRLVTPPGGTVLEPFAGSGTTAEACLLERFHCIAIEREADYLPLILQRINRRRDPIAYLTDAGQDLGLFGESEATDGD